MDGGEEEEASDDDGCTWGYTTDSTEHLKDPRWCLVAPVTNGGSAMQALDLSVPK